MTYFKPLTVLTLITLIMVVTATSPINTHTPIASRWNYNEHLFPIFRDNCGSCHKTDGIAPMSLVTYQEAYPWAQSIREEILGLRMPPGQAEDGFGSFTVNHALSAEEMDMILEWSSGGYPQGPRNLRPQTIADSNSWSLGTPALEYSIDTPFAIDDGTNEIVRFFVIPAANSQPVNISGIDVLPDAGPVVRNVTVYLDSTGTATELDANDPQPGFAEDQWINESKPIAVWSPDVVPTLQNSATYFMPPGADVVVRIHYKKTWITEGQSFDDQTRIGFYLSEASRPVIESLIVSSPPVTTNLSHTFSEQIDIPVNLLSVLAEIDIGTKDVQVVATTPNGNEIPLLFLREPNTTWPTRYSFNEPIHLPAGTSITVDTILHPGAQHEPRTSLFASATDAPIRLMFDYANGSEQAN